MTALITMQTSNKGETSKAGFTMQRKAPKFKCLCVDICMQIRHLISCYRWGLSTRITQLPARWCLLLAEVLWAWLLVPGVQLLLQRGKGCCRAPVCPSCEAVLVVDNEKNVTGCEWAGNQVKLFVNIVRQFWKATASQMQDCFWVKKVL